MSVTVGSDRRPVVLWPVVRACRMEGIHQRMEALRTEDPQNPGPAPDLSGLDDLMEEDEAEEAREPVDWDARTAEALASGDAKEIETRRTTRARQRTGAARKVRQIQQLGVSIEKCKKEKRTAEQFIFGHAKTLGGQNLMDQQLFSYIEHISKAPKGSF